jgi:hypothetical protein
LDRVRHTSWGQGPRCEQVLGCSPTSANSHADPDSDANTYTHANTDSNAIADAATDANADTHADTDSNANSDADPNSDSNANADPDSHAYADAHPDSDAHANTHPNAHPNANTHPNADPVADADPHLDADTHADSNAHAHAHGNPAADAHAEPDTRQRRDADALRGGRYLRGRELPIQQLRFGHGLDRRIRRGPERAIRQASVGPLRPRAPARGEDRHGAAPPRHDERGRLGLGEPVGLRGRRRLGRDDGDLGHEARGLRVGRRAGDGRYGYPADSDLGRDRARAGLGRREGRQSRPGGAWPGE